MRTPGFTAEAAVSAARDAPMSQQTLTRVRQGARTAGAKPAAMGSPVIFETWDPVCFRVCFDYCRSRGSGPGYCVDHCIRLCG